MSETLQHYEAWLFTIAVASFVMLGVVWFFRPTVRVARRAVREYGAVGVVKNIIDPPYDPYPERPIDPERYRQSDQEIEREEQMAVRAARAGRIWMPNLDNDIKHLDGVPWHETELPPANHRCWPQTDGWIQFEQVQRCACGAIRYGRDPVWTRINERRKDDN